MIILGAFSKEEEKDERKEDGWEKKDGGKEAVKRKVKESRQLRGDRWGKEDV